MASRYNESGLDFRWVEELEAELLPVEPSLSEVVAMRERIDKMIYDTIMGGYADCQRSVAESSILSAAPPRCCYGVVIHVPGCKYWNVA